MTLRDLDTLLGAFYKPRPLWLPLVMLLGGTTAFAETELGVQLPDSAKKVGEYRYRASDDYEGVLKYYRAVYPPGKFSWKPVANQPGVRATHIALGSGKKAEGVNIYEANEEVRLYVVPAESVKPVKATKAVKKTAPAPKKTPKKKR